MNREAELEAMLAIAGEAAGIIRGIYATEFAVDYKGPSDPVTAADRLANALICERIAERFGSVPVVAEESDESSFSGWAGAPRVFFVDPLDGTLEFVAKNGEFAVMIGLVEDGRPVAGVVLAPATGVAWIGAPGLGAWEIASDGARMKIGVSAVARVADARVVVSRSHRAARLVAVLDALGAREVKGVGSAGLKGVHVASGRADLYAQPGRAGKRWDACAPEAIVTAAGGSFTDAFGDPIDYVSGSLENDRGFLVSNGLLHEAALDVLRRVASAG